MAIVIYAIIPGVRYTMFGLRSVPHHIIEAAWLYAAADTGMPLAFPEIMLGIKQTIMFARRFRWV